MAKTPTIQFKRGDDFKLDLTVTDTNNTTAIAAKKTLDDAQTAYDAALAADPQDSLLVSSTETDLNAAKTAYADAIRVDITGWTIASAIAWCGQHVADLTITILDPLEGVFTISAGSLVTAGWAPRKYDADIEFTRPGIGKSSSQTFCIEVLKDITNG